MKINLFLLLLLIALSDLCITLGQILLKSAINSLKVASLGNIRMVLQFIIRLIKKRRTWFSFFFSTLALTVWVFVLSKADLNFAFSLDSMHYIFIAFASKLILKEKVGAQRWLGTILVIIGIILVSLS